MAGRFDYVKYDEVSEGFRELLLSRFEDIERIACQILTPSDDRARFLAKLEEAFMWAGKSIRFDQLHRDEGLRVGHLVIQKGCPGRTMEVTAVKGESVCVKYVNSLGDEMHTSFGASQLERTAFGG